MIGLLTADTCPVPGAEDQRSALIEAIIEASEDESLLDRYLAASRSTRGTGRRPASGGGAWFVFPVIPVCSNTGAA